MENKNSFTVCRLCLEATSEDSYEIIDDDRVNAIKWIVSEIDLSGECDSKMCKTCSNKILRFCEFRSRFLQSNSFGNCELTAGITGQPGAVVKQEHDRCCFCQEVLDCLLPIDVSNVILEKCFPEIRSCLESTNFRSCEKCLQAVEDLYTFNITCLNSQETIKDFCSNLNLTPQNVNMYEVYQYSYNSSVPTSSFISTNTVKLDDEIYWENPYREECLPLIPEAVEMKEEEKNRMQAETTEVELCNYKTARKLTRHKNSADAGLFNCTDCAFETKYKAHLNRHILTHKDPTKVIMYRCNSCSYETKHKADLKRHMLNHTDPSSLVMFKCTKCLYETKRKQTLKRHMLVHEEPLIMFKCEMCPYETRLKRILYAHMRMHRAPVELLGSAMDVSILKLKNENGESNETKQKECSVTDSPVFSCDSCPFKTKRRDCLKRHMLIHENTDNMVMYSCELCNYKSKYKDNMRKHVLKHKTVVNMYKCVVCSFKTKYKESLSRHMLLHFRKS